MKKVFLIISLCLFALYANSQTQDSIVVPTDSTMLTSEIPLTISDSTALLDTVSEAADSIQEPLLPSHYLFTQRLLWGEKGLMRNFDMFDLTAANREREIEIRAKMNMAHQITGYIALAGMIGSGISGQMLYNGNHSAKDAHEACVAITNVSYVSSLAIGLFSPPPMKNRTTGFTKLNIHKTLAIVHVASMLTTNILSGLMEHNPALVPYHRAAAITAFSSLFLATVVIKI